MKSALMYADQVELMGLSANLVYAAGMAPSVKQTSLSEIMEMTEVVSDDVRLTPELRRVIQKLERAERRGTLLPIEIRAQAAEIEDFRAESARLLRAATDEIITNTGLVLLQPALDAGLITITDLGITRADAVRAAAGKSKGSAAEVQRWADSIAARLRDPRSRLLLDSETASFVDLMVREGKAEITTTGRDRLGATALGAGFSARLPTLEHATVEEILEVRGDLEGPLVRYRSAVARMSKTLPDIPLTEFDAAVDSEWEGVVGPSLREIQEELIGHGIVKELAHHAKLDAAAYITVGTGLLVGVNQFTDIDPLVNAIVAGLPTVAGTLGARSVARRNRVEQAQRREFYYLHAASQSLGQT
ncbi:hypothetical protein [Pimelobacter sp. 30-1]|uniref:hypothetical protein n=1 Tax=Pimelobacter sp. 30-1 TaxID=2004991 RepID=UPI001C04D389|nr:hypothetical protein [Pimelobacter sp. 30-1]MBU2697805.1 hypothetical protein [Pimelobacter sp. 30-1]